MSDAFRNQWIRQSAARQMLTILTHLCKQGDITIPTDALEQITPGEVMVQSIDSTTLTLHYSPRDTRMFVIDEHHAAERSAAPWQQNYPSNLSNELTPPRLADLLDPPQTSPISTLDDQEMARRETAMQRAAATAQESRIRRGQPLPVTTPPYPPQ
jgi:hypothetical protein